MYTVSGHIDPTLRKYDKAYIDTQNDFIVGSCGKSIFSGEEKRHNTIRKQGREDYQLLYVAKGKYCFLINGEEHIAPSGTVILYKPMEMQKYYSIGGDDIEVYWTHFTGNKCEKILNDIGFSDSGLYFVGSNEKFITLYKWIIKELQLKRENYIEIATGYFKQLMLLMYRNYHTGVNENSETYLAEKAILYFYRNFNTNISINDFAKSMNITPGWFRRCFKKYTGTSPQQFLNEHRLGFARELLLTTNYKISEIAERCGYDNPFYFSRIFTKNIGCSPMEFKKNILKDK